MVAFAGVAYLMFEASMMTEQMWALVSSSSIVLNMSARVPQILQNFSAKSTGQLAFVTFFLSFAGNIARTVTVLLNSDDFMYNLQFIIALGLNTIIIMQFACYWSQPAPPKKKARLVSVSQDKKKQ